MEDLYAGRSLISFVRPDRATEIRLQKRRPPPTVNGASADVRLRPAVPVLRFDGVRRRG